MKARLATVSAVSAVSLLLGGCSHLSALWEEPENTAGIPATDVTATETPTPVFQPVETEPVVAETFAEPTTDPGLNVTWELMGAAAAPYGGVVLHVNLTNNNIVPIPPDALGQATLKTSNYSGQMTDVSPMTEEESGVFSGLDLPLGVGSTTTVDYAFNTTVGALYGAELQVGNVIFKGNLNV